MGELARSLLSLFLGPESFRSPYDIEHAGLYNHGFPAAALAGARLWGTAFVVKIRLACLASA